METWEADCSPLPDNMEEWEDGDEDTYITGLLETVATLGSILHDIDHGCIMGVGNDMEETDGKPFSWYDDNLEEAVATEEEETEEENIDNTGEHNIGNDADNNSIPDLIYANGYNDNNETPETSPPPQKEKNSLPQRKYVDFVQYFRKGHWRQIPVQRMC